MPNIGSIVISHNTKLLQRDPTQQQVKGCNCQGGPGTCQLTQAECQKDNIIYVASRTLQGSHGKYIEEEVNYEIKWEIMDRAPTHNHINRKCRLCLKEIYYIIFRPDSASLNSRNELFNTCRHRTQKLLINS